MAGISDLGMVREGNEDAIAMLPEIGLAILADGMGGHQAGEVASNIAVDVVSCHFIERTDAELTKPGHHVSDKQIIHDAIKLANATVHSMSKSQQQYHGMGSTVVVSLCRGNKIYVGHVGDSRLYRFRDDKLKQLTQDHSLVQEMVNQGLMNEEQARHSVNKNLVTRALGVEADVEVSVIEDELRQNDVYLMCSDGLNDVLSDVLIEQMLSTYSANLENAAKQMVDTVNAKGGPDNVSVILIKTESQVIEDKKGVQRLLQWYKQISGSGTIQKKE